MLVLHSPYSSFFHDRHGAAVATASTQATPMPASSNALMLASDVDPVVSTSSRSTVLRSGRWCRRAAEPDPPRQVGGPSGGVQSDRIAGTGGRVQTRSNSGERSVLGHPPRRGSRHQGHRVATASAGGGPSTRSRHYPDLLGEQRGAAQPQQRAADCVADETGQVGATVFLPRQDGRPRRARISGDGPDRWQRHSGSRIECRLRQQDQSRPDVQGRGAAGAPLLRSATPGTRPRQNQIESDPQWVPRHRLPYRSTLAHAPRLNFKPWHRRRHRPDVDNFRRCGQVRRGNMSSPSAPPCPGAVRRAAVVSSGRTGWWPSDLLRRPAPIPRRVVTPEVSGSVRARPADPTSRTRRRPPTW